MSPKTQRDVTNVMSILDKKLKSEEKGTVISFNEFLERVSQHPFKIFRTVFMLFHDMIHFYIDEEDEYSGDPENVNYKTYKCDRLFVEDTDTPFFSDLPLANRLVKLADSFTEGTQQNQIYIFMGPPGSGKSTFLNNLLRRFQEYTTTFDGQNWEILWRIDTSKLGLSAHENGILEVPCPSHDHPILAIPKAHRKEVIENLLTGDEKAKIFSKKEYDWIFKNKTCTICSSIFAALLNKVNSPSEVFEMVHARRNHFHRRLGEGISVYNPGDMEQKQLVFTNEQIQKELSTIFKDSNIIKYIFSRYAKTNNGVFALMDVKGHNEKRLIDLHGIISEGVHKIEDHEENVNSLFIALMNPEDKDKIKDIGSFADRIKEINVNYVLNFTEEVKIYYHSFGRHIARHFLPGVLENFAKIIISSRLNPESEAIKEWIKDTQKYENYCDENMLLLKMSLYSNVIPNWLADTDRKNFDKKIRRKLFSESEKEGQEGFSGRESINIFNDFYSTYRRINRGIDGPDKLINMQDIRSFFVKDVERRKKIPKGFLDSIIRLYDYNVMEEIKEALFNHNEDRISRDIQNYLFACNYDTGERLICPYTNEIVDVSDQYFESIERRLIRFDNGNGDIKEFRSEVASKFTIALQEMNINNESITQTRVYKDLYEVYINNLRVNILEPMLRYTAYENAIKEYGTDKFKKYDQKTKEEVTFLIKNLVNKFKYTEEGAKQVCLYIIEKKSIQN